MKVKGVDFVFYYITDLKRSLVFYRDILGLKVTQEKESWAELQAGSVTIAIGNFGPIKGKQEGGAAVAFAVDDVKEALEFVKSKKVPVKMDIYESGVCFMAIILDPDGNEVMLHHRKDGTIE